MTQQFFCVTVSIEGSKSSLNKCLSYALVCLCPVTSLSIKVAKAPDQKYFGKAWFCHPWLSGGKGTRPERKAWFCHLWLSGGKGKRPNKSGRTMSHAISFQVAKAPMMTFWQTNYLSMERAKPCDFIYFRWQRHINIIFIAFDLVWIFERYSFYTRRKHHTPHLHGFRCELHATLSHITSVQLTSIREWHGRDMDRLYFF